MKWKVYEAKVDPCEVCGVKNGVFLPYVKRPDKDFPTMMLVCEDCKDNLPYPHVPVVMEMDVGYYFCPDVPKINNLAEPKFREGESEKLKVGDFILEDNSDKPPIVVDTVEKLHEVYGKPEGFQSKALAEMAASDGTWVVPVEGGP